MTLKFQVTGMTCAACSARVEKVTRGVPGVEKADVNLLEGTMQVEAESAQIADAIVVGCNTKIKANSLGVTDVEVSVGFGRETRLHLTTVFTLF